MAKPIHVTPRGRRLKSLDEFEKPEFVGRMARVRRGRTLVWWASVAAVIVIGAALGWLVP